MAWIGEEIFEPIVIDGPNINDHCIVDLATDRAW